MKIFKNEIIYFEILIFGLLFFLYYNFSFNITTDIQQHAQFIINYANGNSPQQVNFLYYYTVYFFSFFSNNPTIILLTSAIILTIATFAKYYITKTILVTQLEFTENKNKRIIAYISFVLLFLISLPAIYFFTNCFYLLTCNPTIWHNSTTIFVMPFVLLLFWNSYLQLQSHSKKRLVIIFILIALNAVTKPSFLFVFFVVYPLFLLQKYEINTKTFWINLLPIACGIIFVILEYYLIYLNSEPKQSTSSIAIYIFHFFIVWSNGNNSYLLFILSILSSFLFPIVLILKNNQLIKSRLILYAISCTFFAILVSVTIIETGNRVYDGNFLWQVFMCSYLLFFSSILELLKLIIQNNFSFKKYFIELFVLTLHFVSGIIYLVNIFQTKIYF